METTTSATRPRLRPTLEQEQQAAMDLWLPCIAEAIRKRQESDDGTKPHRND